MLSAIWLDGFTVQPSIVSHLIMSIHMVFLVKCIHFQHLPTLLLSKIPTSYSWASGLTFMAWMILLGVYSLVEYSLLFDHSTTKRQHSKTCSEKNSLLIKKCTVYRTVDRNKIRSFSFYFQLYCQFHIYFLWLPWNYFSKSWCHYSSYFTGYKPIFCWVPT